MWKVKASVVLVVVGAHGAVTPKLGEWLQQPAGVGDLRFIDGIMNSQMYCSKPAVLNRIQPASLLFVAPELLFLHYYTTRSSDQAI